MDHTSEILTVKYLTNLVISWDVSLSCFVLHHESGERGFAKHGAVSGSGESSVAGTTSFAKMVNRAVAPKVVHGLDS